ncbi:hypothetical protein CCH79_00004746, partial [Gambusia affinis]
MCLGPTPRESNAGRHGPLACRHTALADGAVTNHLISSPASIIILHSILNRSKKSKADPREGWGFCVCGVSHFITRETHNRRRKIFEALGGITPYPLGDTVAEESCCGKSFSSAGTRKLVTVNGKTDRTKYTGVVEQEETESVAFGLLRGRSGGKDSCYNMMQCVAAGHKIVALANLRPAHKDELDSYMYQTVGHQAIELYADAMELPLYRRTIQGSSLDTSRNYSQTEGDEVEDLYQLLYLVKEKEAVEAVSVGAILSDYQRVRVENVCLRLGLQPLAYLWHRDQESLLSEMISSDLHAILIKVAAFGEFFVCLLFVPSQLTSVLVACFPPFISFFLRCQAGQKHKLFIIKLSHKYGVHICGEGGEYETFTLDCPIFKKKITIDEAETVIHSADAFAPVGYLRFTKMHVEDKHSDAVARALPHGSCPCQSAIDKMTEEVEYADQAEDNQHKFTSNCDLSCHWGHDEPPSCSKRCSRGYQWISGINGLRSQDLGIESQTLAALAMLQDELQIKAWKMKDIVLVHLYVRNMEDFVSLNAVYRKYFDINPPARVCVQAPLPGGQLLQMDCLLHDWTEPLEEGCFRHKEALHVQSFSHWAPANIGPYSQAFK